MIRMLDDFVLRFAFGVVHGIPYDGCCAERVKKINQMPTKDYIVDMEKRGLHQVKALDSYPIGVAK